MREVRRYSNRRMYDTKDRAYVALDEIGRWIDEGALVRIVDAKTNADVTVSVLVPLVAQRLLRDLRGSDAVLLVHSLIRGESICTDTTATAVDSPNAVQGHPAGPATDALTSLEARVTRLELLLGAAARGG